MYEFVRWEQLWCPLLQSSKLLLGNISAKNTETVKIIDFVERKIIQVGVKLSI
jgi:hypothetical protein